MNQTPVEDIIAKLTSLTLSSDDIKSSAEVVQFLNEEKEAAVLQLRKDFLGSVDDAQAAQVRSWCEKWLTYVSEPVKGAFEHTKGLSDGASPTRLQKEDVPRTFATEANRAVLLDLAVRLQQQLGDYSQAMLFVQAFFYMFFSNHSRS